MEQVISQDALTAQKHCIKLFNNEENNQEIISLSVKDSDTVELEGKQSKKLGKSRSRSGKMEFPMDCGPDAEGDHSGPGVPSSREEKVSRIKTALAAYEKAEEILLRGEEDVDRPDLLSLVQTHHAQGDIQKQLLRP
ncbi:hypothetical protein LXL04_036100 [Taraxacum kok-saghyz]